MSKLIQIDDDASHDWADVPQLEDIFKNLPNRYRYKDGVAYNSGLNEHFSKHNNGSIYNQWDHCIAIVDTNKRRLLLNADNSIGDRFDKDISFSFRCLSRLIFGVNKPDEHDRIATLFHRGNLKLVDSTEDDRSKEWDISGKPLPSPGMGYSIIENRYDQTRRWHRSASVLWRLTYKGKTRYFLMGQDEGTYFGVQLPSKARTINEAYTILTPKEARIPGTLRHGEWFFAPSNILKKNKVDVELLPYTHTWSLERDTHESNTHCIISTKVYLYNNQIFVCGGEVTHLDELGEEYTGQHTDLYLPSNQYFTIHKNTALLSVSEEGVD